MRRFKPAAIKFDLKDSISSMNVLRPQFLEDSVTSNVIIEFISRQLYQNKNFFVWLNSKYLRAFF